MKHSIIFVCLTVVGLLFITQAHSRVRVIDHTIPLRNELSKLKNPSLEQIKQLVIDNEERFRKENLNIFFKDQKNQRKWVGAFEKGDYSRWNQAYAAGITNVPRDLEDVKTNLDQYEYAVGVIKKNAGIMDRRLSRLFGKSLDLNLYMTSAIAPTNALLCRTEKGTKDLCFNLFVTANLKPYEIQILLAHELYHLYESYVLNASIRDDDLIHVADSKILRKIYSEGWATYASSVLIPGKNESDYLFQDVGVFDQHKKVIYKKLLKYLDSNSDKVVARYVVGRSKKDGLPIRSGYYVGFRMAQELAKTIGSGKVMRINYLEFVVVARKTLEQMTRE